MPVGSSSATVDVERAMRMKCIATVEVQWGRIRRTSRRPRWQRTIRVQVWGALRRVDVDAGTGVAGLIMGLGTGAVIEGWRAGICTTGLRPTTWLFCILLLLLLSLFGPVPPVLFSRLRGTGCSCLGSALVWGFSTSPAGEHILHVQFAVSLLSSVHNHNR